MRRCQAGERARFDGAKGRAEKTDAERSMGGMIEGKNEKAKKGEREKEKRGLK